MHGETGLVGKEGAAGSVMAGLDIELWGRLAYSSIDIRIRSLTLLRWRTKQILIWEKGL
jgi:hypothetical protein